MRRLWFDAGQRTLSQEDVEIVARRMAGMPLEIEQRLHALREALCTRSLLPQQTVDALNQSPEA